MRHRGATRSLLERVVHGPKQQRRSGALAGTVSGHQDVVEQTLQDPLVAHRRLALLVAARSLDIAADVWADAPRWQAPCLIAHGTADTLTDPRAGRRLATRVTADASSHLSVEGRLHELRHDETDLVLRHVLVFTVRRLGIGSADAGPQRPVPRRGTAGSGRKPVGVVGVGGVEGDGHEGGQGVTIGYLGNVGVGRGEHRQALGNLVHQRGVVRPVVGNEALVAGMAAGGEVAVAAGEGAWDDDRHLDVEAGRPGGVGHGERVHGRLHRVAGTDVSPPTAPRSRPPSGCSPTAA
ncbi:serine aminopeptidase domain-containing protein [Streptomyces clavifer]|uniref:serine aminopeptidase domain-containing protein n=1 Tax=Streptomyces clavifer TaxID=68188 RepID=UPI0037A5B02C